MKVNEIDEMGTFIRLLGEGMGRCLIVDFLSNFEWVKTSLSWILARNFYVFILLLVSIVYINVYFFFFLFDFICYSFL